MARAVCHSHGPRKAEATFAAPGAFPTPCKREPEARRIGGGGGLPQLWERAATTFVLDTGPAISAAGHQGFLRHISQS